MKQTRRIKITTTRRRTVRIPASQVRMICPVCGREVGTLDPAQAAGVLGLGGEGLAALIAAGEIHELRTAGDAQLICRDSAIANPGSRSGTRVR